MVSIPRKVELRREASTSLTSPCKYTTLNSCTNGHNFVWVYTLHWVFAKNFFNFFHDGWHTSHTTNENDFVNVACF